MKSQALLLPVMLTCLTTFVPVSGSEPGLSLNARPGPVPRIRGPIPHQQMNQNSPEAIYRELLAWSLTLPDVSETDSANSFPSARGLYIARHVKINYRVDREFAHIHRVPGPGSMHLKLPTEDIDYIAAKGWGRYHPISRSVMHQKGKVAIAMIYAPRDRRDLVEIKKIIRHAYDFALRR